MSIRTVEQLSARNQGLLVELVDDRLVISIGIDALMLAVVAGDDWDEDEVTITSPDGFAQEIVAELEREEEDGTTPVHLLIDQAVQDALDAGSLSVRYAGDTE